MKAGASWDLQMGDYFGNTKRFCEIECLIDNNYKDVSVKYPFSLLCKTHMCNPLWIVYDEYYRNVSQVCARAENLMRKR